MRLSYAYLTIILSWQSLAATSNIECLPSDFSTKKWSQIDTSTRELITKGQYQEAILHLNPSKHHEQIESLRQILENILGKSSLSLQEQHEWKVRGATKPKIVSLACQVKGILKVKQRHPSSDYRAEIGAYRIDKLLGFNFVPPTVLRMYQDGKKEKKSSLQYFMSQAQQVENSYKKNTKLLVFDYILHNTDRNIGNIMMYNGKEIAIDHGLALKRRNFFGRSLGITDSIKRCLFIKTDPIRTTNLNCKKADWSQLSELSEKINKITQEDINNSIGDLFSKKTVRYIYSRIKTINKHLQS
jgi:hypothetical protein